MSVSGFFKGEIMLFKSLRTVSVGFVLGLFVVSAVFAEVRHITPPKLEDAYLGEKVLCHRPMRRGSPKLDVQKVEDKIIAHNYGHGGSGWTLAPGSAKYVLDLLEAELSEPSKDTPIAVVGAGALGLFSAVELLNRGYTHITVIAENFDNLTSHNAGGLLAPVSMDNDPKMQSVIDEIGIEAYKFYKSIALGEHSFIKTGARVMPTYFPNREDSGLEPYVGKVMAPAKDVTLDFGNGTRRKVVAYDDGIFMDTSGLLGQLKTYLDTRVAFEKRKIANFKDLDQKIIINCTGLGAAELNNDEQLVSVQGHLVMLKDQTPTDLEHMILAYFGEDKTQSGFKVTRSFYMFPKQLPGALVKDVGVIGGTFIEGADARFPNEEEFDLMIQGAREFYGLENEQEMKLEL